MYEYVCIVGPPKVIQADNGPEFDNIGTLAKYGGHAIEVSDEVSNLIKHKQKFSFLIVFFFWSVFYLYSFWKVW